MTTADYRPEDHTLEENVAALMWQVHSINLTLQKLIDLQASPRRTVAERVIAQSTFTADQLDALAIDALGSVAFDVRTRPTGRFCEVSRKAVYDYLTETMQLSKADAYAVNDHIASRPGVEEFKVRTAVWFRWAEGVELFPVDQPAAEVVELKSADGTKRKLI